jgi:hypothetical protein
MCNEEFRCVMGRWRVKGKEKTEREIETDNSRRDIELEERRVI